VSLAACSEAAVADVAASLKRLRAYSGGSYHGSDFEERNNIPLGRVAY
jgi:hypothetical protein